MQVIDVDPIDGRLVPDLIRLAVAHATAHAAAGEPECEAMRVVIAPRFGSGLSDRKSAEFAAPDDERLVEQASLRQVGEQRGDRLVRFQGELRMVPFDVHVSVPTALVLHPSGIDLNEPHASFDHASSDQALARHMVAMRNAEPIQILDMFRFRIQVDRFRSGRLHAKRQLETLGTRRQLGLGRVRLSKLLVQPLDIVELMSLQWPVHAGSRHEIIDRRSLRAQVRSLVDARQEGSAPVGRVPFGKPASLRIGHHNETGQIVVLASQSVRHP